MCGFAIQLMECRNVTTTDKLESTSEEHPCAPLIRCVWWYEPAHFMDEGLEGLSR